MKNFDEWWKKYNYEGIWDYGDYFYSGWEAALEWVKEKLECEICPGDIEYFIDKELKSE